MKPYIYLSMPIAVSFSVLEDIAIEIAAKYDVEVRFWDRVSLYDSSVLLQARAIVFYNPAKNFCYPQSQMPSGVYGEYVHARKKNIPIFLAYTPSSGKLTCYNTECTDSGINGIAGSYLQKSYSEDIPQAETVLANPNQDRRLLFLLK